MLRLRFSLFILEIDKAKHDRLVRLVVRIFKGTKRFIIRFCEIIDILFDVRERFNNLLQKRVDHYNEVRQTINSYNEKAKKAIITIHDTIKKTHHREAFGRLNDKIKETINNIRAKKK